MAGWTTLVQADVLSMALERRDVVIIDCRFSLLDPHLGEQEWLRSHIAGAVHAHLDRDLSEMGGPVWAAIRGRATSISSNACVAGT